jgi:hypothetical protein
MTGQWWSSDDELMTALGDALRAARKVPPDFIETAKASYAWHNVDVELAALTYDSSADQLAGVRTRAEPAALRSLTFAGRRLTIELEVIDNALHGQIVPPESGEIELQLADHDHTVSTAVIDDVGYFTVGPVPAVSFRLRCRTSAGYTAVTNWVTL